MWFNIDFNKLTILLLPTVLREPITVAYAQALLKPIDALHYDWLQKRQADWYKLEHTGQVCRLRKVLNDQLDPILRRITIGNGTAFPRRYIYTKAENKPKYLGTFFIKSNNEYQNTGVDFRVFVPNEIVINAIFQLNYLIKFYKLAGKRYIIEAI
ncbi:hypothetical protein [Flavobacterium sp.]|uniref:hypothetical protein n=1 Tax=Flavobacterium sp. TaxID=239 RepID=UPI003751F209